MTDTNNDYNMLNRCSPGLCAFVVVARHGQLSSAARELRISQPGLSQRIRQLETTLGVKLFNRTSRGVRLSEAGTELFARIDPLLTPLARNFNAFRNSHKNPTILIAVDYAFASFWLLPRLSRLREAVQPIDISLLTSQSPAHALQVQADLVIRIGAPDRFRPQEQQLFAERVSAVCSPAFLKQHPAIRQVQDLLQVPLLSLNTPLCDWYTWESWLQSFGITGTAAGEKTVFNSYDIVIRAAQDGLGVALGWHGLIDTFLENRELVCALDLVAQSGRGYFIELKTDNPGPATRRVHEWIIETCRAETETPS